MTKYAAVVMEPNEIAYHMEKALHYAVTGRKGPVWLDIPLDVQGAVVDTEQLRHFDPESEKIWDIPDPDKETVKEIFAKIKEAKAPLILAGAGIRLGDAENEFLELVQKLKIPVVTAWNSNDELAFDSPYFVGMPGTLGTRSGNFAVQNCDLLLSLGCRLNLRMIGYNHFDFAKKAYKILVDIDKNELIKPTIKPDMTIHSDVKKLLQLCNSIEYIPNENHDKWRKWCKDLLKKYPAALPEYFNGGDAIINPYVFIDRLFDALNERDRIICGNGSACVITFQAGKIKQGQRMFTNSGCAAMGYGLPAALGVAVSDNSDRVICIDGDGSIMMNIQELATIAHNHLNVKIILLNNHGYHSIRQTQQNLFKEPYIGIDESSGVGFPDFQYIAKAFHLDYYKIESEKECDKVISDVLNTGDPVICEVFVDSRQKFEPKSSSKILPDGKIVSPSLDDMAPFLPRDEFEKIVYRE